MMKTLTCVRVDQQGEACQAILPRTLPTVFTAISCPGVQWKESDAILGRFDIIDLVESDDPKEVARARRQDYQARQNYSILICQ
jgi:hypothetical protein